MPTRKDNLHRTAENRARVTQSAIAVELEIAAAQLRPSLFGLVRRHISAAGRDFPEGLTAAQANSLQTAFLEKLSAAVLKLPKSRAAREIYPQLTLKDASAAEWRHLEGALRAAFDRVALRASITPEEKKEILAGMLKTRLLDARLKKFFISGEIKTDVGDSFQGKGFRSMGQEAIYAAAIRLIREPLQTDGSAYQGDFVAPMIRDLGLALAMGVEPYDVLAAQMGKPGKPTDGHDLHIGDFARGVLPPAAPIGLSTTTAIGIGLALKGTGRVVVNCNGEGGCSTGEWHESINFAAVNRLPMVFVLQNNQTALSTPVHEQFAASNLAARGQGYGIGAFTIDGTDPEAVFAAVTEAAERCRQGQGPVIVELVCMRMCGHAHHDDMLYFGAEPDQFTAYPDLKQGGYADPQQYAYWREKDPVERYAASLVRQKVIGKDELAALRAEIGDSIEEAAGRVVAAPWPAPETASRPVVSGGNLVSREPLEAGAALEFNGTPESEPVGFETSSEGKTFWQAIVEALGEEMARDPEVFLLGEDVGGTYGNAFVILRPLLEQFGTRILNTPLAESAIIGAATGAALLGKRPVAEMQFNDFVASGFNVLVNATAKIYPRWRQPVPLTIRMPWGGLRSAGPYHSQNTEPWFYRTPGLKIVCPSTPIEAKALLKASIRDDNPVLFYEHIALYRAAEIRQTLPSASADTLLPIGRAHRKRAGTDLTIITYGAYVHRCLRAATQLEAGENIQCEILDLRSLLPLDKEAVLKATARTGRVLIVQEDSKTGSIGQSVASIIGEEAFVHLDAPVRVLGALDAPVPYSPPLEEAFLVSVDDIVAAARDLLAF